MVQIREFLGRPVQAVGCLLYVVVGLVGLIIVLDILIEVIGFWGAVLAFMFLPITLVATPWYALVAWGNPFPLILIYGGGIVAGILMWIGSAVSGD